jgi:hypothetical protein
MRMARDVDVLTLAALGTCVPRGLCWVLRPVAWWWALGRWWLFTVAWSAPMLAVSRRKRTLVALHEAYDLVPCYAAAALDRAARQVLRHQVERRIKASDTPWLWDGDAPGVDGGDKVAGGVRAGAR